MPVLRTGAVAIKDGAALPAKVVSHHLGKTLETIRLDLTLDECKPGAEHGAATITLPFGPGRGRGHGVVRSKTGASGHLDVLVARPAEQAGQPIVGDVWFAPSSCQDAAVHQRFQAATAAAASDAQLPIAWAKELAAQLGKREDWRWEPDAWHAFAQRRLLELSGTEPPAPASPGAPDPARIARLMETTTGIAALQEALQSDRPLLRSIQQAKPTIAIASLHGPALEPHRWAEMQKALGRAAPVEALASSTPAEFYYVRFSTVAALLRVLDQADAWASPILSLMGGRSEDRGLSERYQTQLGLERGELARAFGDRVVAELAVVGSDPYFGAGTDVTILFRVKSRPLLGTVLAAALRKHGAAHGGIATSTVAHHEASISVARSADGAVHQYRAQLGDLEVVSNSLTALRRVLDTRAGRHPSLAAEPDFQYNLARDAGVRADVLAFIGDRFVAEVVGPRQKILEARRQVALAELSTPAYAALLYGWLYGKSPSSADELIAAGLLGKPELSHHDGEPIAWRPGDAPRSSWGTPSALTPLIDLPPLETVTPGEQSAYEQFAASYQAYWTHYLDPIAIRVAITNDALTVDTRVLPLIAQSEYAALASVVGRARVSAPPIRSGVRAVLGLDRTGLSRAAFGLRALLGEASGYQWLGSWAAVGVEDRTQVAAAIAEQTDIPQGPEPGARPYGLEHSALPHLPAYLAVGIRDRVAAAAFLVTVRKYVEDAVPGVLTWGESSRVRDVAIVRISAEDDTLRGASLYYAFVKDAFVLSLDEHTIRRQIEAWSAGAGPGGAPTMGSAPQLVLEAAGQPGGALWTAAAWLLEASARTAAHRARSTAEALLYGAPEVAGDPARARELALRIFGAVPLTADGRAFELGAEGVRDPLRGSQLAPAWPALPVAGSPIARLLGAISRARCEIGFDGEPSRGSEAERSLHLTLTLGARQ